MTFKVLPADESDNTLRVVHLGAIVGELVPFPVKSEIHVTREEALRGHPVVLFGGRVVSHLVP